MSSNQQFYATLFGATDLVCFSPDPYGTAVTPVIDGPTPNVQFFSINPLHTSRKDVNVTAYRNLLFEIDDAGWSTDKQLSFISAMALPYTSAVWSGGKSIHFIISLTELCSSRDEYDALWRRIYLGLDCKPDGTTKNPSRFSRVPGAVRDNGNKQELLVLNQRVTRLELANWFSLNEVPEVTPRVVVPKPKLAKGMKGILTSWTERFIAAGAPGGEWNVQLFKSSCDAFRNNYEIEEWCELLLKFRKQLDKSDLKTIKSAWDRVVYHSEV